MAINYSDNANAICPFYLRGSTKSITCEGFAGEGCMVRFASEDIRREWARTHCESESWRKRCPYAAMMGWLYEDQ